MRLYFAEPEDLRPGDRIFDVQLQGEPVLKDFDIVAEAGSRLRGVVKEFHGVRVQDRLTVALNWAADQESGSILCGVEMIREKDDSGAASPAKGKVPVAASRESAALWTIWPEMRRSHETPLQEVIPK